MATLLIVDDDDSIISLYKEIFKDFGDRVITTNSPYHAKELASYTQIDILITDYDMPGINGIELSEYCYEQCGSKNILVSGHSNIPYSSSLLKLFKKPFSILKLMEYVLEIKNEKNTLDNPSINPIFETSTTN